MMRHFRLPALAALGALAWVLPGLLAGARAQDDLDEAQKAAGRLVRDRMLLERPRDHEFLRRCPREAILLVDGVHDHTDRVLSALRLPFDRCPASDLSRRPLRGVRLLIIDCPGELERDAVPRVRRFVEDGGRLLTTDWSVLHVIEEAFPGTLRYTRVPTRDDVVRISRVENDPLLWRVFPPGRPACWWLENRSYPVETERPPHLFFRPSGEPSGVRVLLESDEMGRRYGSPLIAATFACGRGRVVHVVSHTYLQRNELRDPWERRAASAEVDALGLPAKGEAYEELRKSGVLDRVPAGHMNAALSIQQFLLNIVVDALGGAPLPPHPPPPPPRVEPPPPPPPPPFPPPRLPPPRSGTARVAAEAQLRDRPGGDPVLHVGRGLLLEILEVRDGWARVSTPAGQTGWVVREEIDKAR
jgi:hypothetical protein